VLSMFLPERTAELLAMVTEAWLSPMYAGIHYGFDIDKGRDLGHGVAGFARCRALGFDKKQQRCLTAKNHRFTAATPFAANAA